MELNFEENVSPLQILFKSNLRRGSQLQSLIEKYSVQDGSPEIDFDSVSDAEDYDLDDNYNVLKKRYKSESSNCKKKLFSMRRLEKLLPFTSTPIVTRSIKNHNLNVQLTPLKETTNSTTADRTPTTTTTTTNKQNQETSLDNNKNDQLSKQPVVLLTPLKPTNGLIKLNNSIFRLFDANKSATTNNNNNNNDKNVHTAAGAVIVEQPATATSTDAGDELNNNDPLFNIFKSNSNKTKNKQIRISDVRSCATNDNKKPSTTITTTTTTITSEETVTSVATTKTTNNNNVDKLKQIFLTQPFKRNEVIDSGIKISEERRLVLEKRRLENNNRIANDPLKMLFNRN